jgi:hypothetical protein
MNRLVTRKEPDRQLLTELHHGGNALSLTVDGVEIAQLFADNAGRLHIRLQHDAEWFDVDGTHVDGMSKHSDVIISNVIKL